MSFWVRSALFSEPAYSHSWELPLLNLQVIKQIVTYHAEHILGSMLLLGSIVDEP